MCIRHFWLTTAIVRTLKGPAVVQWRSRRNTLGGSSTSAFQWPSNIFFWPITVNAAVSSRAYKVMSAPRHLCVVNLLRWFDTVCCTIFSSSSSSSCSCSSSSSSSSSSRVRVGCNSAYAYLRFSKRHENRRNNHEISDQATILANEQCARFWRRIWFSIVENNNRWPVDQRPKQKVFCL